MADPSTDVSASGAEVITRIVEALAATDAPRRGRHRRAAQTRLRNSRCRSYWSRQSWITCRPV